MPTVEELVIQQRVTANQIRRIVPNYRKLGKEKFSVNKTRTRIQTLQELWSSCRAPEVKIQQLVPDAQRQHPYFVNCEYIAAEDDFEEALDQLTEIMDQLEQRDQPAADTRPLNSTSIGEAHGTSAFALPRITIPKFSGEPTRWESFRDTFKALVGENTALTAGQKLYYLKSFLEGTAALMLEHVPVSDANYEGAWKMLEDEYNNMRALVLAHLHAFISLPAMKSETETELKRLRDTVNSSLTALKNLGRPVGHWDDLLVYLITQKFSLRTRTEWNLSLGASNDFPTFRALQDFITERVRGIATPIQLDNTDPSRAPEQNKYKSKACVHNAAPKQCVACSGNHHLGFCPVWHKKSIDDRFALAKRARVCFNCLKSGHFPQQCPSLSRCRRCQKPHHTTLHRASSSPNGSAEPSTPEQEAAASHSSANVNLLPLNASLSLPLEVTLGSTPKPVENASSHVNHEAPSLVLLATAWVQLRTPEDRVVKVRALLDQGSTHSFISESLTQTLRTPRQRADLGVTSFGDAYSGRSTSCVKLTPESCFGPSTRLPLVAYIYQKITSYAANQSRCIGSWPHLKGLTLADPAPSSREPIIALIGADLYGHLLVGPLRKGPLGSPTAQLTSLGWIISGPTDKLRASRVSETFTIHCGVAADTDALIRRFWEIEEVPTKSFLTPEEEECERHFVDTHSRDTSGRYVVRLPFRGDSPPELGASYQIALARYKHQESRFMKKAELASSYSEFLAAYESMGHMEEVRAPDAIPNPVYIPHHSVIRESSSTTRMRVVFNASSATSNGTSLNEHLHVGPKLQREIGSVLSDWRRHRLVYMADIEKMFRQIKLHRDDTDYQRILCRREQDGPVRHYRLLTVTYGTACAPYHANRVLLQLADDEGSSFSDAVDIIRQSTYVDDVLFGADNHETARNIRVQITSLLERGGFHLRKWASNDVALLADIPAAGHELAIDLSTNDSAALKVLGITWLPREDAFSFQVGELPKVRSTKRTVLSLIARLFDPLGWASPVIIEAKLLMQDLWLNKADWDDTVPPAILERWENYCRELHSLSALRIPRWIGTTASPHSIELHGFADASQRAFSAVVYVRILNSPTEISVSLLAAKSKVAPLQTVAIPRLELNGVVLLVRLLQYVKLVFKYDAIPVYGWTDSTVALAWLRQHPSRWKPYVANRVSEIQTKLPEARWHHVSTRDNPADCASRGIEHPLWWSGPSWLSQSPLPGLRRTLTLHRTTAPTRQSSFTNHAQRLLYLSPKKRKTGTFPVASRAGENFSA